MKAVAVVFGFGIKREPVVRTKRSDRTARRSLHVFTGNNRVAETVTAVAPSNRETAEPMAVSIWKTGGEASFLGSNGLGFKIMGRRTMPFFLMSCFRKIRFTQMLLVLK